MPKFVGIPAVALELVAEGGGSYIVEEGTSFESISVEHPFEEVTVAGTVVAIELAARHDNGHHGRIFDGIPTHHFDPDDMGNIKNASDYFTGNRIAIEREDGTIAIIPVDKIKAIGGTVVNPDGSVIVNVSNNETLIAALSDVVDGTTVIVNEDAVLTAYLPVTGEGNVVLDLNGHEIVREDGTCLYVNSENVVLDITGGTLKGAQAVYGNAGIINIHDGHFENAGENPGDCIYAMGKAQINIYGGEYHALLCEDAFAEPQHSCLNIKDADKATASIKVYGGRFYNFDPANNVSENPRMNFVAEGYKSVEVEPGIFEVVVDEDYVAPEESAEEIPAE